MTKTSIQAYSLKTTGISCDDIRLWKNALFMYWQLRSEIGLILQQFCKFSVFGLCLISRVDATSHRRCLPAATLVHSDVARPPQRRGKRDGGDTGTLLLHSFPLLSLLVGALWKIMCSGNAIDLVSPCWRKEASFIFLKIQSKDEKNVHVS